MKNFLHLATAGVATVLAMTGCERKPALLDTTTHESQPAFRAAIPSPLALALAPHEGECPEDKEIRRFQDQVRQGHNRSASLERLGWAFVTKARTSFDSGFYKLAEACANILETDSPGCAESLLLRGHVLQNLHRFAEAEQLAHELVSQRGLSYDFALLGDTLMEQGRLAEAVTAYQRMADTRPDPQAYTRIAHVRWLTGDLDGAIEMMESAAAAADTRDADTAAWVITRLAALKWQAAATGSFSDALPDFSRADGDLQTALALRPDYPPALLLRGKMALAQENFDAAIVDLQQAAQRNPLPEYQWALADALRAAGRDSEADATEGFICRRGAEADARTLSLYLATRGQDTDLAVRLAEQESNTRADVFTHDALAWASSATGRHDEARARIQQALAKNTVDARLLLHAAVIASRAGATSEAEDFFARAVVLKDLLLPSEQTLLLKLPDDFARTHVGDESVQSPANTLSASGN